MLFKFLDLPEDIIVKCLSFCDVTEVFRLHSVCKYLKDIASSRTLLLQELFSSKIKFRPCIAPHVKLQSVTNADLKSLLVSAHRSHKNWTDVEMSTMSPSRSQTMVLPRGGFSKEELDVMLVPVPTGSLHEYLVIRRSPGYVQCLEISTGECVSKSADSEEPIISFDVDSSFTEDTKIFRIMTISKSPERQNSALSYVLNIHEIRLNQTGKSVTDDLVFSRNIRSFDDGYRAYAKLEGNFVVIFDRKTMKIIDWKDGKCTSTVINNLQIDTLRLVEAHLMCLTLSGPMMRDISLMVLPLQDVLAQVEPALIDDGIMMESDVEFAQLPAVISKVVMPEDCIPVFATPGFCNRAWRGIPVRNDPFINDVTFFMVSEVWHRRTRMRYFVLHKAQFDSDRDNGPAIESSNVSSRVLQTAQVGRMIAIGSPEQNFSSQHCISQSGRILVNAVNIRAISIQDFLPGFDTSRTFPLLSVDNQPLENKEISMDPCSGAVCCWAPKNSGLQTTIHILHFD